jgi:hypothetical protein
MDKGGLGRGGWLARALLAGLMGCSAAGAVSARTAFPADPPIPVQKPGFAGAARTIELPSVLSPFASPDAPGDAATGSEAPLSNQFPGGAARQGDANGALRVEIPALPKTTVSPSLRLDGNGTTNPNDIRVAPPRDQEFNPTPGLNATVDLGDMTLGTNLSQSLKGTGPRIGSDGRPTGDGTSVGVDMKMKF